MSDIPKLAAVPRRSMPLEPAHPLPMLFSYMIEVQGEPPRVINLNARSAALMDRLMAAGSDGVVNRGEPRLTSLICRLRQAGAPITTVRVPKLGDGTAVVAQHTFDEEVISDEKLPTAPDVQPHAPGNLVR